MESLKEYFKGNLEKVSRAKVFLVPFWVCSRETLDRIG